MDGVERKFHVMDVNNEPASGSRLVEFIQVVDDTKMKKQALKMLDNLKDVEISIWNEYVLSRLSESNFGFLSKVSALLEFSPATREIMDRNYNVLVHYMGNILEQICNEEENPAQLKDSESFSSRAALAAKVCLQMAQFIPVKTKALLLNQTPANDRSTQDAFRGIIQGLLMMMCKKGFPKDASLLSGTAMALLLNLHCFEDSIALADQVVNLLKILVWGNDSLPEVKIFKFSFKLPAKITSVYSQISLIHGLVTIGAKVLTTTDSKGVLVLKKLLDTILENCLQIPDATSKYVCFKTISSWLNYLLVNDRLKTLSGSYGKNARFFVGQNSQFMEPLMALVKNHIEDLVDGIPHFTQKIFNTLLQLYFMEHEICQNDEEYLSPKKFVKELSRSISEQGWFMKGRWMLFSELVPYIGSQELLSRKEEIATDLMKCLTTCSLPAISNEVYITILKELTKSTTESNNPPDIWSSIFLEVIISSLLSDNLILRQNLGQYWLPSTFRIIPSCFERLENRLRGHTQNKHFLHGQVIILKTAWSIGLISSEELGERKDLLRKASQSIDLDVRIETFNVVCSNSKKTEPLPTFLQNMILEYVRNNLNCDSSKFRQQMFSALKRLLLNVRDSSIVLHRQIAKPGKGKTVDANVLSKLNELIEFVEEILRISHVCLSPGSSYQRRKTGLQLLELLSNLFVYVKDVKKRRKGAATESFLGLLEYIDGISGKRKWNILSSMDNELLSCMEDQHDEIRELAVRILLYQQSLLLGEDELLADDTTFVKLTRIAFNLLSSPRFHEVESGACYIYFIANRITGNEKIFSHLKQYFPNDATEVSNGQISGLQILLNALIRQGEEALSEACKDFLLSSTKRPIYGYSIAASQILRHISEHGRDLLATGFASSVQRLLKFCNDVTIVMVNLLAGTFDAAKFNARALGDENNEKTEYTSPSFADIDLALDVTLKTSPSYVTFCESITHLHCRELLLSFCWLNLKSASFMVTELGDAFHAVRNDMMISFDTASMEVLKNFFTLTLVRCRHKGVIENSYASLTKFSKAVAFQPKLWNQLKIWCLDVLSASTDLSQHSSVTKRSAGIPMFIQSILSAEPATNNHDFLRTTIKQLFEVATTRLPDNTTATSDLPQFNAINILRSIFRDTGLGNAVLRYVEDAVILTIDGFSSPSWSIRNASLQLLGTLVPRMLGQRLSQEEVSQQNVSTPDVFFYRYPKLLPFLEKCLPQQECAMSNSSLAISPRLIPALTFLSKLRPSDSEEMKRISDMYLPHLQKLKCSAVHTVRDLTAGTILAFTPTSLHGEIVENYFQSVSAMSQSRNQLHSSTLVLSKILAAGNEQQQRQLSNFMITSFLKEDITAAISHFSYMTRSLIVDIVVKLFTILKDHASAKCLHRYVLDGLVSLRKGDTCFGIARPFLEKSLCKAAITLLLLWDDEEQIGDIKAELTAWRTTGYRKHYRDFMEYFFQEIYPHFSEFSGNVISILGNTITEYITSAIQRQCQISVNVLKCYLAFLLKCSDTNITSKIDLHLLISLLQAKRWPPVLLPCISRTFTLALHKGGSYMDAVSEEDMNILSKAIFKNSAPEIDENIRFAVAQSLTLLDDVLQCKWQNNNPIFIQRQQQVLNRFLWASLNLLQDEDDEIRTEATSSLQFLNRCHMSTEESLQCNITLKNFFEIHRVLDTRKAVVFARWLVDILAMNVTVIAEPNRDLMLFEQEAANLFAEEIVITDLAVESLKASICTISSNWHECDNNKISGDLNQLLVGIHDAISEQARSIYESLTTLQAKKYNQMNHSVFGLFRNRRTFNPLYKLVKMLHFLLQSPSFHPSTLHKEFQDILGWLNVFEHHPLVSEYVKEVKHFLATYS